MLYQFVLQNYINNTTNSMTQMRHFLL